MNVYCFEPTLKKSFDTYSIDVKEKGFTISASVSGNNFHLNLFAWYADETFHFELEGLVNMSCTWRCDPLSLGFLTPLEKSADLSLDLGYGVFEFLDDKFSHFQKIFRTEFGKSPEGSRFQKTDERRLLDLVLPCLRDAEDFWVENPWTENDLEGAKEVGLTYDQKFRPVIVFPQNGVWVLSSLTEQYLARGWLRSTKEFSYESLRDWMACKEGTFLTN